MTELIILIIALVLLNLLLIAGNILAFSSKNINNDFSQKITLIISAKNEQDNIVDLYEALNNLEYPSDLIELIFVDDCSTDKTYEYAKRVFSSFNNFKLIKSENKKFLGKRGALEIGIENSTNEFLIITDADCLPQKNWLKIISQKLNQKDFVFGISPFIQKKNLVNKISCFENLRASLLTFSLAAFQLPYNAAARSLGFRKSSFRKMKGFENADQTISGDDDLLIQKAMKHGMKIGFIHEADSHVLTKSKNTLRDYINQRARHTSASFKYMKKIQFILFTWHIINLTALATFIFIPIAAIFSLPFLIKLVLDVSITSIFSKKFGYKFSLFEVFYLQFFYETFLVINFFSAKLYNYTWK